MGEPVKRSRWVTPMIVTPLLIGIAASLAVAQNYDLDARNVAMGATGSTRNIAGQFMPERRKYHRVGLPFGLFQVADNSDVFRYGNDAFDPFRSIEYARNPFHYTFNRNASNTGKLITDDILALDLKRDLSVYRVFRPAKKYVAEGVGFPNWGWTFKFGRSLVAKKKTDEARRDADGYHGIYVGTGPYLTTTTDTRVDQELIDVLSSPVPTLRPNAEMGISHATDSQTAAAIVAGYRLYVPHHGSGLRPEGLYFSVNVSYLIGFRYDDLGVNIRFDTDAAGLITLAPTKVPIELNLLTSSSGAGRVIDIGAVLTLGRWDVGAGVSGIANRITWKDVTRRRFQLPSYLDGSEFDEVPSPPITEPVPVTVPLNTSTNVTYTADRWSVAAEYSLRFEGNNIQSGAEYRFDRIEIRGGLRYARDRWHPAGGVGINLTPRYGVDVAILSTSTNVERRRTAALVFSIRIESKAAGDELVRR